MQPWNQGHDQAVRQHQEGGDGVHDHAVRHDTETEERAAGHESAIPAAKIRTLSDSFHTRVSPRLSHSVCYFVTHFSPGISNKLVSPVQLMSSF